jgi:hypothetical protein
MMYSEMVMAQLELLSHIYLEGLRKEQTELSSDSQPLGQDLNLILPKFEPGVLHTQP